ncbi:MAG: NVEALA domain-containing protein [Prevotellaceae bacterium]|nr:NVEALA domain-containing protein [Prevotellaceae bacterium]
MKKSIKCGIAAAVVVAAGVAAYQSYGAYGAQDNSLLMQNVEALAQDPDGNGDPNGDVGTGLTYNPKTDKYQAMANNKCSYWISMQLYCTHMHTDEYCKIHCGKPVKK